MRKIHFILILLFLGVISNAQETKFGVFIEPQVCWLKPEAKDVEMSGRRAGLSGGLSIDRFFQENYAFSTAIGLSNQGGKLSYTNEQYVNVYGSIDTLQAGTTLDYKLQYLTIPIGLKLKSNEIGYFTFLVQLGFDNQFNIKARASSENDAALNEDSIKEEIGVYNLSYYFGGGIEYALSEDTAISLGVYYHSGVLDVTKAYPMVNSRQLGLRLGINF